MRVRIALLIQSCGLAMQEKNAMWCSTPLVSSPFMPFPDVIDRSVPDVIDRSVTRAASMMRLSSEERKVFKSFEEVSFIAAARQDGLRLTSSW